MEIYSCDTMVALGNSTRNGHVIFAKNSDRPVGEAQPLVVFPASDHNEGEMVKCTYLSIPQVKHTYRVIGSKPDWIWGFEQGMNEKNVVIGNEAVWAKEEEERENGLIGMDLLRLALERGASAYEALHVITSLLEKHGQGGNCAQHRKHRYHNAFLIADTHEAWVLETCNRRWVARRVNNVCGISNCYSTQAQWDEESGDVREHAYEMKWISANIPFDFAKAYSAMGQKHRAAWPRYVRINNLLKKYAGDITIETMTAIQRDHFEGEIIEPRYSPADGLFVSVCMHAIGMDASQTAASSHVEVEEKKESVWWHAFCRPCASVFAPYKISSNLPIGASFGGEFYEEDSVWWKFERLQNLMEQDFPYWSSIWKQRTVELETKFLNDFSDAEALSDEDIRKNTELLLQKVDEMTTMIMDSNHTSSNPQRTDVSKAIEQEERI